ncbi:bifunctional DNA primase/polymerase, partial [Methylomagnum sp.]
MDILARYGAAGFHFVRIPRVNGRPTKGPTGTGWNRPRTADNPQGYTPDVVAARDWLKAGDNIGLALLPSRVASLDLDDFDEARRVFGEIGLPLADWLNDPGQVEIRSGKPGKGKLLFYVEVPDLIECSRKLVFGKRPHERAVFELRFCSKDGKTIQDVLPPSIHPDTGQPYALVGDPTRMPPLPPALLKLWQEWPDGLLKSFDPTYEPPKETPPPPRDRSPIAGQRDPIAEFNAVHTVESILEVCGYTRKGRRWLRPGSESGIAGVVILEGGFCYSHGGDALNDGHKHDAFDCHRLLKCGGDWAQALAWNADLNRDNKQAWETAKAGTKARFAELARTLRGQGQSESRILDALLRENQAATPPLLDAEIKAVLRSSGRRGAGN